MVECVQSDSGWKAAAYLRFDILDLILLDSKNNDDKIVLRFKSKYFDYNVKQLLPHNVSYLVKILYLNFQICMPNCINVFRE